MTYLPDTQKRIRDLPNDIAKMWNESGYKCFCGNMIIVASKEHLFCSECERYWIKAEVDCR